MARRHWAASVRRREAFFEGDAKLLPGVPERGDADVESEFGAELSEGESGMLGDGGANCDFVFLVVGRDVIDGRSGLDFASGLEPSGQLADAFSGNGVFSSGVGEGHAGLDIVEDTLPEIERERCGPGGSSGRTTIMAGRSEKRKTEGEDALIRSESIVSRFRRVRSDEDFLRSLPEMVPLREEIATLFLAPTVDLGILNRTIRYGTQVVWSPINRRVSVELSSPVRRAKTAFAGMRLGPPRYRAGPRHRRCTQTYTSRKFLGE